MRCDEGEDDKAHLVVAFDCLFEFILIASVGSCGCSRLSARVGTAIIEAGLAFRVIWNRLGTFEFME